jgi:hypothetical protein
MQSHENHIAKKKTRGISEEIKAEIVQLYQTIKQSKSIQDALERKFPVDFPSIDQIYNFLSTHKKNLYGESSMDVGKLEEWCKKTKFRAKNLHDYITDQPFSRFIIDATNCSSVKFYVFLSTINLINQCKLSEQICTDATYKLIYEGFPVLICVTTDRKKRFYPFEFCSDETNEAF